MKKQLIRGMGLVCGTVVLGGLLISGASKALDAPIEKTVTITTSSDVNSDPMSDLSLGGNSKIERLTKTAEVSVVDEVKENSR